MLALDFRMESVANNILTNAVSTKVEMDNSYKAINESGYSSQQSASTKWECHENEITDTSSFDPMPVCSSNVKTEISEADISSITGEQPHGEKGKKTSKQNCSYRPSL